MLISFPMKKAFIICTVISILFVVSAASSAPKTDIYGMQHSNNKLYGPVENKSMLDGREFLADFYGNSPLSRDPFNLKKPFWNKHLGVKSKKQKEPQEIEKTSARFKTLSEEEWEQF